MYTAVPLWGWIATLVLLILVVSVDLVVIGRRSREISTTQAARWVTGYVALALLFGGALSVFGPPDLGGQFFAGYVTEYSLSVDNLFVFVIIMARFAVPPLARDKTLYVGIALSLAMRAVFIVAGVAVISAASWTFYVFGAFLVFTAVRLVADDEGADAAEYREGRPVRSLRRLLPVSDDYDGDRVFVRRDGRRMVTPLAIAIVAIGIANVVFALDSIPAVFGLTQDTFVVLTANAFALMGLRQLFFLIGGLLDRLVFLDIGLAIILAFVGVKLVLEAMRNTGVDHVAGLTVPGVTTTWSLAFIVLVLLLTIAASLAKDARIDRDRHLDQTDDRV